MSPNIKLMNHSTCIKKKIKIRNMDEHRYKTYVHNDIVYRIYIVYRMRQISNLKKL